MRDSASPICGTGFLPLSLLALVVAACASPTRMTTGPFSDPPPVSPTSAPACTEEQVRQAIGARVQLVGRIRARDSSIAVPAEFQDAMYGALANRRVKVEALPGPASARVEFTIDRQGDVKEGTLTEYSGPAWFAEQVLGTLASASLTRSVPPMPRGLDGRSIDLVFEVRAAPAEGWRPFPLRLAVDTSMVDSFAMTMPGMRPPKYPVVPRAQGVNGDVLIEYIVMPDGRADMTSVSPVTMTTPEFLHAVLDVLPTHRFITARLGDCTVPSWVKQPFSFRVAAGPAEEPH